MPTQQEVNEEKGSGTVLSKLWEMIDMVKVLEDWEASRAFA